ncbi:hypothetical protein FLJU110815_10260 [Flavobacterium jumunjinense]
MKKLKVKLIFTLLRRKWEFYDKCFSKLEIFINLEVAFFLFKSSKFEKEDVIV